MRLEPSWMRLLRSAQLLHSCSTLCDPVNSNPPDSCPWDSLGKNTGVGFHALLQGLFLTQGSNPCLLHLLHCRQILYHWATRKALKSALIKEISESSLSLLSCEDTARGCHLWTRTGLLTRHWICWHLDLRLPNFQNYEQYTYAA